MADQQLAEKIIKNVYKAGCGCWLWTMGSSAVSGYGTAHYKGRSMGSHVASYIAFKGDLPKKMVVCHSCDVRLCCNPDHLFAGTTRDNFDDLLKKGRKVNAGSGANKWKIDMRRAIDTMQDKKLREKFKVKFRL